MYTIGQFSKKTGVTIRTLRYYDEKGLLKPTHVSESGRRHYEDQDLITLQKILTFKFLGYALEDIQSLMATSALDFHQSLQQQKQEMLIKKAQIEKTIETLEHAIALSEKQEHIHTDIFLSIIHDLIRGDEQKVYLKKLLPEDLVDEIYDFSNGKLLEYNKHFMSCGQRLKEAYRLQLPDEEVIPIIEELFSVVPIHLIERVIEASKHLDDDVVFDDAIFQIPFSKEEEQWLEQILTKLYFLGEKNNE